MRPSHKHTCTRLALVALMALIGLTVLPALGPAGAVAYAQDVPTFSKAAPAAAIAGETFNYTISFNNGGVVSNTVTVSDPLPAGTTFVAATAPAGWASATPPVGSNGTVTFTRGVVAAGESAEFTITVRVCSEVACNTVLSNTATLTVANPPRIVETNPANTRVQAQADLAITKTGSTSVDAGSDIAYTLRVTNLGPSNSNPVIVTDMLPAGWSALSATPSVGNCMINGGTVSCNLGSLGGPNQCTTSAPTTATITILAHVPAICQPMAAVNTASATADNCLADPNPANNSQTLNITVNLPVVGPGACVSPTQNPDAGSVLLYSIYSSSPTNLNDENTRINITNTHPTESVAVHLFFVDGRTCVPADALLCLTPNQTASFFASDIDPGTSGYIVAVAVGRDGCPISFNFLIGSANVKLAVASSRKADLEAESIAAEYGSPLPGCNPGAPTVTLPFNGLPNGYGLLPRTLALDSIPSPVDGNDTLLIVNRFGGDMTAGAATIGSIFGILYDDAEVPHSFTLTGGCQIKRSLSNAFPRTTPVFSQVIPSGRTGWMKFWAASDVPIFGAAINYHPRTESSASAFGGGHNLHKLTLTTGSLTIPIIPPPC